MLISRKHLNKYIDLSEITTEELADRLTNAGLEVEGIDTLIHGTNLVVGHVLECVPHPDSDHLNITQVDLGTHVEQIVCGASNVAKDQYVVVAKVGAKLKDFNIKETSIRGVQSNGMICSLNELGVAEKFQTEAQKEGIVVLEGIHEPGSDAAVALGLDDEILDVSQTPNRSDFLSIFSVAREVSALIEKPVSLPNFEGAASEGTQTQLSVSSKTDKSPMFLGKVINHVSIQESPSWMREVLIAAGIKPINNVVDISNLVMLETGQPLHFYDIDHIENQTFTVVDNFSGDVEALDGETYTLIEGDLVIMNQETPVGIAGVMGLGNSMITANTRGIIIEAARFNAVSVRKTSNRLGIFSDASARFTKPMDAFSTTQAMDRAVQLLREYADAQQLEETVVYGSVDTTPIHVSITTKRINDYLGTTLEESVIVDVFNRLNFEPKVEGDVITCTIPSYRKDITIDVDLIEEVIRIVGYDILDETLPLMDLTLGDLNPFQKNIRLIEKTLLGMGAYQTNTYTLVDEQSTQGLMTLNDPIKLMSPLSDKRAYLRTGLFASMMDMLRYNHSHRQKDGLYFEHSAIYANDQTTWRLAMIGSGSIHIENWATPTTPISFYDMKGMFLTLMDILGYNARRFDFVKSDALDALHPYKSCEIHLNRKPIGVMGHVHPTLAKENDIEDIVYLEIDLETLLNLKGSTIKSQPISKYPVIQRDLAVLCSKDIMVKDLIQTIEKASKRLLKDLVVFDVFTSDKLGDNQSIAFELTFGDDKTLEVDAVNDIMASITDALVSKHKVEIR